MSKRTVARARLHAQERRNQEYPRAFEGTLSAATRGYKQLGRKLAMRDSYDFFEAAQLGKGRVLSLKELEAVRREEAAAYGPDPEHDDGARRSHWNPMQRAMDNLNTRDRKAVLRVLWADSCCSDPEAHYPSRLSRAQLRAIHAAQYAEAVERAIDADERMLANAY